MALIPSIRKQDILIVTQAVEPYRKHFYEQLSFEGKHRVTAFFHDDLRFQETFKTIKGKAIKLGSIKFQTGFWSKLLRKRFGTVVAEFDLHLISNIILLFFCKLLKINFIWWGHGFGKHRIVDRIRAKLATIADAIIVYEAKAKNKYVFLKISRAKIFVMQNTIYVPSPSINLNGDSRNTILIIGKLHKRKKINNVIKAFHSVISEIPGHINVTIIGGGPEKNSLIELTHKLNVQHRICFLGEIWDPATLRKHFHSALAVIHPGAAGLAILHSFAHGVPFVTENTSSSGPEIENIKNNINGLLYDGSMKGLKKIIVDLSNNPELSLTLGKNAFEHYTKSRTMNNMVSNFSRALDFVSRE